MFLPNSFQKCRSSRSQMFFRSSRPEMFCKKAVLRDFPKFTRKHLCQSLFIRSATLFKKRPCSLVFPVNFAKFGRTPFLTEHLWWLLLVLQNRCFYKTPDIHQKISVLKSLFNTVRGLKAHNFNKKRPQHKCFPVNITKFLRITVLLNSPSDCFLIWSKNF